MKTIAKILLKGLVVIVPVGVTLYVVWWLGSSAEALLRPWLEPLLPAAGLWQYRSGTGVLVGLVVIFLIGLLTYFVLFQQVVELSNRLLAKIPLVKTIFEGIRDMMAFVSQTGGKQGLGHVVLVELAPNCRLIGLVTQQGAENLPPGLGPDGDNLAVYLPMSYQLGGFTIFVPRSMTRPLDMSVEKAMRYALTAGMGPPEPTS